MPSARTHICQYSGKWSDCENDVVASPGTVQEVLAKWMFSEAEAVDDNGSR